MTQRASAKQTKHAARDEPPRVVGRYELLHAIASGGMATVYLGRACGAAGFQRLVAVKCCHPHFRTDQDFVSMFLDEARLAARIHHPNVVPTLDVGEDDELSLYMVMEFVDGYSLWDLLKTGKKHGMLMPVGVALRIMIDALNGLHAAHELCDATGAPLNLVHRDVSPQNILVGTDGVSRILDFGIAKAESRLTITREGTIKGKLTYMAPEQYGVTDDTGKHHSITRRADIYSAGVVLWESLTGKRLFYGESDAHTLRLKLHSSPAPPSTIVPAIPQDLDALVLKALEHDPEKRFSTALEFAEVLEDCGVKVPPARAVAQYLAEVLHERIEERRTLLRTLAATPPLEDTASKRVQTIAVNAETTQVEFEPMPVPLHRRRGIVITAAVVLLSVAAMGLTYALWRPGSSVSIARPPTTHPASVPAAHPPEPAPQTSSSPPHVQTSEASVNAAPANQGQQIRRRPEPRPERRQQGPARPAPRRTRPYRPTFL